MIKLIFEITRIKVRDQKFEYQYLVKKKLKV
jgi:hypothetical protein